VNPSLGLIHRQWSSLDIGSSLLQALTELSPQGQRAINLRFWENYTIEEISEDLRMSWDDADELIEQSLKQLRMLLLEAGVSSPMIQAC
jgi:DNA-directed RNA polymerase specialized sigma24 family protein